MAPATSGSLALSTFFASATKAQLVIFYVGLSVLCILLLVVIAYSVVWLHRFKRRRCCAGKWYGWRNCLRQLVQTKDQPVSRSRSQGSSATKAKPVASPPAWALAYKKHIETTGSGSWDLPVSPYGMPMLRRPMDFSGFGIKMEATPTLPPASSELEQDITDSPRGADTSSEGPLIIVECGEDSERISMQDTIFPVFPVLSSQKSVIDYLSIPPPHWYSPDLIQDDGSTDWHTPTDTGASFGSRLTHQDDLASPTSQFNDIKSVTSQKGLFGLHPDWKYDSRMASGP